MEADFARERRRTVLSLVLALTAGFLPVIVGTWLLARRTAELATSAGLGAIWVSLGLGATSCTAIVALALIPVNRYHRMLVLAATRDHLTGAYTRQAFKAAANEAWAGATRSGRPLSVLLLDVDDFKHYNDRHGHNAGDAALREVVRTGIRILRGTDIVCRWGGDEFVVLLPACDEEQAMAVAARLGRAVSEADPQRAGMPAPISISTGVAEMQSGAGVTDTIARADEAMYNNRRANRSSER